MWFGLTALLIFGTLTVGAPSAAGQPFRIINPSAGEPESTLVAGPAPSEIYPSTAYGGVTWSLVGSRMIPRTQALLGRPIVVVEAIVTNTTTVDLRIRHSDVAIVWANGRRDQVDRFEHVDGFRSFTIEPGQQAPVTLVFKPNINADPALESMHLEIQEPGRVPASIPLVGRTPAQNFPMTGAIDQAKTILDEPTYPGRQLIIGPLTVSLALDAGPYRAALGERLVIVEVSVKRAESAADAAYLTPNFWRLAVDGDQHRPVRVTGSASPAPNQDQVTLLFVVDAAERSDMQLTVADGTSSQIDHAITFPSSKS